MNARSEPEPHPERHVRLGNCPKRQVAFKAWREAARHQAEVESGRHNCDESPAQCWAWNHARSTFAFKYCRPEGGASMVDCVARERMAHACFPMAPRSDSPKPLACSVRPCRRIPCSLLACHRYHHCGQQAGDAADKQDSHDSGHGRPAHGPAASNGVTIL